MKKGIKATLEGAQKSREMQERERDEVEMQQLRNEEIKSDPGFGALEPRVQDSMHDKYQALASTTLPIDRVPEDITRRMVKVFSKHYVKEVREWGQILMKNYQLLHAVEKPMNLNFVKPYANTSDLQAKTPNLHPELAKERAAEQ